MSYFLMETTGADRDRSECLALAKEIFKPSAVHAYKPKCLLCGGKKVVNQVFGANDFKLWICPKCNL